MNALGRDLLDLLFASLWQGACIGVAVVAVLALTGSRLNAATRYIVLLGALFAIAIVPLVTTLPNTVRHTTLRGRAVAGSYLFEADFNGR